MQAVPRSGLAGCAAVEGGLMGWGEPQGPRSAQITAKAELIRKATALADAVAEHRREGTTGSTERMYVALDGWLEAQRQVLAG